MQDVNTAYKNITITDEGKETALQLFATIYNLCNHSMLTVEDLFFSDDEENNTFHYSILSQLLADLTTDIQTNDVLVDQANVVSLRTPLRSNS